VSRGTLVYITMIVVCVAGVWGILHAGNSITAAPDLTGIWATADGQTVIVEQSGRFVRLRMPDGVQRNLVLDPDYTSTRATGRAIKQWFVFDRPDAGALVVEQRDPPPSRTLTLTRPATPSATGGKH